MKERVGGMRNNKSASKKEKDGGTEHSQRVQIEQDDRAHNHEFSC